jgi:hypothetical protein
MTEIGVNLPWFGGAYGHDLGRNQAYPDWPIWYEHDQVEEMLGFLATFGIGLARIWLFEEGEGLKYGPQVNVDDLFLHNLQDLVNRIRANGIKVYWTLFDANAALRRYSPLTARILTNSGAASQFTSQALSVVAPIIEDVTWAVDLCNEPEAIVGGKLGTWSEIERSLGAIREGAATLLPGTRFSIGSRFKKGAHEKMTLDLDFLDFHHYHLEQTSAYPNAQRFSKPVVLGELGCAIKESDRDSEEVWRETQERLARSLDPLTSLGYEAAFLWFLNAPDKPDAASLVFRRQIGAALQAAANYRYTRRPLT